MGANLKFASDALRYNLAKRQADTNAKAAGQAEATSTINKETADAERRASEVAVNSPDVGTVVAGMEWATPSKAMGTFPSDAPEIVVQTRCPPMRTYSAEIVKKSGQELRNLLKGELRRGDARHNRGLQGVERSMRRLLGQVRVGRKCRSMA